jgi:hypothetical protein
MSELLNVPKCHNFERCGNRAISLINGMWLCGNCVIKVSEKVRQLKEKILLEE